MPPKNRKRMKTQMLGENELKKPESTSIAYDIENVFFRPYLNEKNTMVVKICLYN